SLEVENNPLNMDIKIRDFGFPIDDSRHWGHPYPSSDEEDEEAETNEYTNRRARALYDFQAENPTELSFQEGDILLIQDRQCAGWLIADLGDETGLVPENYVALLGDDEEEEDEYGDWANEEQQ
ncbi:9853_t:CDS:2, partial [Acaulospora morrowiae]